MTIEKYRQPDIDTYNVAAVYLWETKTKVPGQLEAGKGRERNKL